MSSATYTYMSVTKLSSEYIVLVSTTAKIGKILQTRECVYCSYGKKSCVQRKHRQFVRNLYLMLVHDWLSRGPYAAELAAV